MITFFLAACFSNDKNVDETGLDTADLPCEQRPPELTIGTGEFEWNDLDSGDSLMMVHGPQGGWHMLGSIRLSNTRQVVEIDFGILDIVSGVYVSNNHYRVALVMQDECTGYYPGMYGYMNVTDLEDGELDTPPELLGGHTLRIEMKANDCTVQQDALGNCVRSERWSENTVEVEAELDPEDR